MVCPTDTVLMESTKNTRKTPRRATMELSSTPASMPTKDLVSILVHKLEKKSPDPCSHMWWAQCRSIYLDIFVVTWLTSWDYAQQQSQCAASFTATEWIPPTGSSRFCPQKVFTYVLLSGKMQSLFYKHVPVWKPISCFTKGFFFQPTQTLQFSFKPTSQSFYRVLQVLIRQVQIALLSKRPMFCPNSSVLQMEQAEMKVK